MIRLLFMLEKMPIPKSNVKGRKYFSLFINYLKLKRNMIKLVLFFLCLILFTNCKQDLKNKTGNETIINIEDFITLDSAFFEVPKSVLLNYNTHIHKFVTNDSLLVLNLVSGNGHIDNYLYIYNLKTKTLTDSICFLPSDEIKDFLIIKTNLYVLVNEYNPNKSKIINYNLLKKEKIDSNYVFVEQKDKYVYVNKLFQFYNKENQTLYFLLTSGKQCQNVFPLVGSFNTTTKKINYIKCWYPLISDKSNDEYYENDNFTWNNYLYVAYKSTPYCSKINLRTNEIHLTKMNSFLLDSLFGSNENDLKDILKKNYSYYTDNQKVIIDKKEFLFRYISLDDNLYGTDLELLSITDSQLNCIGEQLLYYFKDREKYLKIAFAKKFNDSLNITTYIYNNKLVIRKGIFKTRIIKKTEYFNQLDMAKKEIEKDKNAICPNNVKTVEIDAPSDNICGLSNYIRNNDYFRNSKNLLILSANTCPSCVKNMINWYFQHKNRFLKDLPVLVVYKNENNLNFINEIAKQYSEFSKFIKIDKYLHINSFLNFDKPFILLENINDCKNSKVYRFDTAETDSLQNLIMRVSGKVIIVKD